MGVSAVVLLASACGGGSSGEAAAADCAEGAQVVRVQAMDTLRFDPDSVSVKAGEPVCFVVTNEGDIKHEFVVGGKEMQDEHEQEMAGGASMGEMDMGDLPELELEPGETKSVTTTFDEPGQMLFACHEPGHYAGGMVGTLTITA
ncbi:MAG TPA: plastocyanin/azurin family copper-binding protein [Actinomycetota bacterium]|jgi:uncharacterized cupredoxin-like copper-binding protein|nr:plastocyanin/azurin family copper-binding protein [Actinomycetota bacterium]